MVISLTQYAIRSQPKMACCKKKKPFTNTEIEVLLIVVIHCIEVLNFVSSQIDEKCGVFFSFLVRNFMMKFNERPLTVPFQFLYKTIAQ